MSVPEKKVKHITERQPESMEGVTEQEQNFSAGRMQQPGDAAGIPALRQKEIQRKSFLPEV